MSNIPKYVFLSLNTVKIPFLLVPVTISHKSFRHPVILQHQKPKDMKKTRVTALGDSLTKGVILNERNRYSVSDRCYMDLIGDELDIHIENYGKFGCTISSCSNILERHAEEISSSDYTFIEYGGNDCDFDWMKIAESPLETHAPKTGLEVFSEQFCKLIQQIRNLGSKPIIISLPPILSETYFSFFSRNMSEEQKGNVIKWLGGDVGIISRWHESYNRALFMIAQQTQTQIIDITTPFDTYRGGIGALYCTDGIHPNEKGHKLIAETIINKYL